tara:strand:+ start:12636 stop:13622 length:987 start_codon:yes stop_codon:yes gene_type:complete
MLFINYILLICFLQSIPVDFEVFASLVSSYILTGIAAFLVNDYYDKKVDLKAGKSNLTEKVNSYSIGFLVLLGFSVSFLLVNRISQNAGIVLLVQFASLFAYSHPRVRLKTKPIFGVIADSIYAYIIPVLLLFVVYKIDIREVEYLAFLLFNFSIGIRDILLHQKADEANDLKSGISSFAIRHKTKIYSIISTSEYTASFSLFLFFTLALMKQASQNYMLGVAVAYMVLLFFQIVKIRKAVGSNYMMRFYVVLSSFIIFYWLLNENEFSSLILLIHPYFIQFFIELIIRFKNIVGVIVNYSLYYSFKLIGRDLKTKPLYKRDEKKSSK